MFGNERIKMSIPEQLQKELHDEAILALQNPDLSEKEQLVACMMSLVVDMANFKFPPKEKERIEKAQKAMCDALEFSGCEICYYDPEVDRLAGCFLLWKRGNYTVKIDFEDKMTVEEIEYIVIDVHAHDVDRTLISGACVKTMEEVKEVCKLLTEGKTKQAKKLLLRYDPMKDEIRSKKKIKKLMKEDPLEL
jgi:hypothetical protein